MQPGNRIIQFHNIKRSMQMYEKKIRNAKPTLTTRILNESKSNTNLIKTSKQPYGTSFSRMIDIELQNKALLKKLTQKSNAKTNLPINNNNPLQPWQQPSLLKLPPNNRKKYYEEHQRRIQNQGLLRRLKEIKPIYQMRKYMSQRKVTEKYINIISKFLYKDFKPTKTIYKFDAFNCRNEEYEKLASSRKNKIQILTTHENESNKQNQIVKEKSKIIKRKNQFQSITQDNIQKTKTFSQRNLKKNKALMTQKDRSISPNDCSQNPMAHMCSSHLSGSNLSNLSQSFYHFIPEQQVKLNGKTFILKGKQSMTKLKLQLLEVNNKKTLGNEFIHEVQIPAHVYAKKFEGRIDVLVERLRFDKKAQGFYLL